MNWSAHRLLHFGAAIWFGLGLSSALAATIQLGKSLPGTAPIIIVDGELVPGDAERFQGTATGLRSALVVLRSDGGQLLAGIEIGTTIRLKNFETVVPNDARCASACALAWIGGTRRYVAPRGRVGFHAAWRLVDGKPAEAGSGNALVGAYLNRIALPDRAILYMTQAPPESMSWLTARDAERVGIEIVANPPLTTMPQAVSVFDLSQTSKGPVDSIKIAFTTLAQRQNWSVQQVVEGMLDNPCFIQNVSISGDKSRIVIWAASKRGDRRQVRFRNLSFDHYTLAAAHVNGRTFALATDGAEAWFQTDFEEQEFVAALARDITLSIQGTSGGQPVRWRYRLAGFEESLEFAEFSCRS